MPSSVRMAVALPLLLALAACGEFTPTARVEVDPGRLDLGYPRAVTVRFEWHLLAPIDGRPTVFVHLHDHPRSVARTFDHPFPGEWRVDEVVEYELPLFQSALGPALDPGKYRVSIGLYEGDRRWSLQTAGEMINEREYAVIDVEVPVTGTAPELRFSPEWGPLEAGLDLQHLGRRRLQGEGTIRVEGLRDPAALHLGLWVPPPSEGASAPPAIVVDTSCGQDERRFSSFGRFQFALDLTSPDGSEMLPRVCEIAVRRDLPDPGGSLWVESLAWTPAGE